MTTSSSSYNTFTPDNYALSMLTQAAMHAHPPRPSTGPQYYYSHPPSSASAAAVAATTTTTGFRRPPGPPPPPTPAATPAAANSPSSSSSTSSTSASSKPFPLPPPDFRPASINSNPPPLRPTPPRNLHPQPQPQPHSYPHPPPQHQASNNATLAPRPEMMAAYNHPTALSSHGVGPNTTTTSAPPFDPAGTDRRNSYMAASTAPPGPPGASMPMPAAYANHGLSILNSESYDDSTGAARAAQESEMRLKHRSSPVMPFGLEAGQHQQVNLDLDLRVEGEEAGGAPRRRKKAKIEKAEKVEAQQTLKDDEEDASKKARGRPRVETKDETAAERRRTQIRMAQRAYRHRKETTISSLEKKVRDLRGTNEEMSSIFISLYDLAVDQGLMQREPEFGQQLQATTERFLALSKSAASEDHLDESLEDTADHRSVEAEQDTGPRARGRKTSPKKQHEATAPAPEPVNPWGGYTVSKGETTPVEVPVDFTNQAIEGRSFSGDLQVITRPTEDNASFPLEFMDLQQQYRVDVPTDEHPSQGFLPRAQLAPPTSYSWSEFSLARRILRLACQRALILISMKTPPAKRFQEVFGFCKLYESRDETIERLKGVLGRSINETLQVWRAPFVHIGGSGTFYPTHTSEINGEFMPKFRTGYSMGPFSVPVSQAQQNLQEDLRCSIPGFEGEFFDANDVEGYLRGRGLEIPPAADLITAEIDVAALTEAVNPTSMSTMSSTLSPKTPHSPFDTHQMSSHDHMENYNPAFAKPEGLTSPFSTISKERNSRHGSDGSNDPSLGSFTPQSLDSATPNRSSQFGLSKRKVTIDVEGFLNELAAKAVCLGRAPGFRPADIDRALLAALVDESPP